jgi:hypothetical protein
MIIVRVVANTRSSKGVRLVTVTVSTNPFMRPANSIVSLKWHGPQFIHCSRNGPLMHEGLIKDKKNATRAVGIVGVVRYLYSSFALESSEQGKERFRVRLAVQTLRIRSMRATGSSNDPSLKLEECAAKCKKTRRSLMRALHASIILIRALQLLWPESNCYNTRDSHASHPLTWPIYCRSGLEVALPLVPCFFILVFESLWEYAMKLGSSIIDHPLRHPLFGLSIKPLNFPISEILHFDRFTESCPKSSLTLESLTSLARHKVLTSSLFVREDIGQ